MARWRGGALLLCCSEPTPESPVAAHDAQRLNRACASCHVEIAGEWARSQHYRSADRVPRRAAPRAVALFAFVLGSQGAWRELVVPSVASSMGTVAEGFVKPEGAAAR